MSVELPTDERVCGVDAAVDYLKTLQKRGIRVTEWTYDTTPSGDEELYAREVRSHDPETLSQMVAEHTVAATARTREEDLEDTDEMRTVHTIEIDGYDRVIVVASGVSYEVKHTDEFER